MPNRVTSYLSFDSAPANEDLIRYAVKYLNSGNVIDFGGGIGGYSIELSRRGFNSICADLNLDYLKKAKHSEKVNCGAKLPFKDLSFDGAICFEVLEHLTDPNSVLIELKRCVNGKLVFSVPCIDNLDILSKAGLAFDHILCKDHCNYYTKDSLYKLLSSVYSNVNIFKLMPVQHYLYLPGPGIRGKATHFFVKAILKGLRMIGLIHQRYYSHLVAVCE